MPLDKFKLHNRLLVKHKERVLLCLELTDPLGVTKLLPAQNVATTP